ncbi:hypothetical protein Q1695_013764 [Nippostrongylus brasiliensis]|nr:hypothetical protein Q1695_013764 [Nippostrongylus brasiliensis]
MSGPNGYDGLPKDEESNGNQCSDEGPSGFNIIDFVVPSHERMRDIENGIQEIVGDGVTEARARAGGDGCANDEIFLIVVAVLIFIQTVIGAVMERNYFSAAPVVSLIMAILIIIGVLMKSGCVMLCVLICAIILVIIYIVQLIFVLVHGTGGGGSLIVVVLVLILVIICTCCVCFAANNLRGTYG